MIDLPSLKTWLQGRGVTTPISFNSQPEDPTNCYTIIESGGIGTSTERALDRPTFQVLTRASGGGAAHDLARDFDNLILDAPYPLDMNGVYVLETGRVGGGPTYLGLDDRNRPEYTSNYYLTIGRV